MPWYLPSCSLPSSAAWPVGKIVLTKMPILPFGESRPPTMENPRLFFPGPFSNTTVWNELGRVLFTKWWPLLPLFLFRGNVQNGSGLISDIGSPPPRWCCSEEWPSKFAIIGKKKNISKVWFHETLLVYLFGITMEIFRLSFHVFGGTIYCSFCFWQNHCK